VVMRLLGKRRSKRRVFGFPCDPGIALLVRHAAQVLETPIYPLAEHMLQIGCVAVYRCLEDEKVSQRLHDHIIEEHLLVEKVSHKEKDSESIIDHIDLSPEQQEQAKLILNIFDILREQGLPHQAVVEVLTRLAWQFDKLHAQNEVRQTEDFKRLKRYHRADPRFLPSLMALMEKYSREDIRDALDEVS